MKENREEAEEEKTTTRRDDWFRRADDEQFSSSSLSGNDDSPGSSSPKSVGRRSSDAASINAELLGAYPRIRGASNSIRTADASCDSQRRCSSAASSNTEQPSGGGGGGGGGGDAEETIEDTKKRSRAVIGLVTEGRVGGGGEPSREVVADSDVRAIEDKINFNRVKSTDDGSVSSGCSCEGACGCATVRRSSSLKERSVGRLWPVRCISMDRSLAGRSTLEETNKRQKIGSWRKEWELERSGEDEEMGEEEREKDEEEEEEEEELPFRSRSSAIVKLLGGGRSRGKRETKKSGDSPVARGGTTIARSARKLPIQSREGYLVGRSSTSIGALINSYEKLSNGELRASPGRRSMHASDPVSIGSSRGNVEGCRRYSSCDLESLCEGIRILNELLARRGLAVAHGRKQSVTVMLYGTPRHGSTTRRRSVGEEGTIREIGRVSRFSLDALSN
ncbi:hypothetical protein K0M31_005975 [Melipona bicolor]|uniref:Uncharacterized protein n=1 Tax=Melipona bicolor TaxID=60889 RepID=A0AA40KLA2_9HYME|nr:hypothetical protein K0M31_005975 [Melipona bicolor]